MKKTLICGLVGIAVGVTVMGSLLAGSAFASTSADRGDTQIEASINETYAVSQHTARGDAVVLSLRSHKGNVEALVEGCNSGGDLGEAKRFSEGKAQTQTLVPHIEPGTCFKLILTSDKNTTVKGTLRH